MTVKHRNHYIPKYRGTTPSNLLVRANERLCAWLTHHVLASLLMFDLALVVPLVTLPLPDTIKVGLVLVLSNWIQWWALPALQRSANEIQVRQDAQADANHETMTHIAETQNQMLELLKSPPPPNHFGVIGMGRR